MGEKNNISQSYKMTGKRRLVLIGAGILLLTLGGAGATKLANSNNNKTSKAWELIKQRRSQFQNNPRNDVVKNSEFHGANGNALGRSPASSTMELDSKKEREAAYFELKSPLADKEKDDKQKKNVTSAENLENANRQDPNNASPKEPGIADKIADGVKELFKEVADAIKDMFGDGADKSAGDSPDAVAEEGGSGDEAYEEPSLFDEIADAIGEMFGDGADEGTSDSLEFGAEDGSGGEGQELANGESELSGEEERAPGGEGQTKQADPEYAQDEGAPTSFGDEGQSSPGENGETIADGSDEGAYNEDSYGESAYDEGGYGEDPYSEESLYAKAYEETAETTPGPEAKSSSESLDTSNQVLVTQTAVTTPNCNVDRSPGIYSSTIDVAISCDQASDIFYCFQKDGCCSPYSQGTLYSEPITVGAVDGEYCISYFASPITTFTGGSYDTDMAELDYRIDSTTPSLLVDTPVIQLQTTHPAITSYAASKDYGKPFNYLHKINLNNHDPTSAGLNWSCEETLFDHKYLTNSPSYTILDSYDVSNTSPLNEVNVDIYVSDLLYGENHISTILEDSARKRYACQSTKVVLEDFQLFRFSGAKGPPAYSGTKSSEGGFVSYGHFEEAPSDLTRSGQGKNTVSNISLTTSFQSMRHE